MARQIELEGELRWGSWHLYNEREGGHSSKYHLIDENEHTACGRWTEPYYGGGIVYIEGEPAAWEQRLFCKTCLRVQESMGRTSG